jgi:hypothetical protein
MDAASSLAEYQRRLADRKARAARLDSRSAQISNLRLITFAAIVVVIWLAVKNRVDPWWLVCPIAAFVALVVWHDRVIRAFNRAQRAIHVYEWGIARIEDRWHRFGRTGERFRQATHVYANDLDLFGEQSLFQLLSTARTTIGEEALAKWLLNPAPLDDILGRQEAISELRGELDFREELSVTGEDIPPAFEPAELLSWAEGPELLRNLLLRAVAPVLAVAALGTISLAFWKGIYAPAAAVLATEFAIHFFHRKRVQQVIASVEGAGESVMLFSALVKAIGRRQFQSARLQQLRKTLGDASDSASRALAVFSTRIDLVDSRDNLILRVLNIPLLYELQTAFAVEAWRRHYGALIRSWLSSVGEIEALISFAAYSYEHPADPFPQLTDGHAPQFVGESLGHPLLPSAKNVRNSVQLDRETRALIVSGSNMSGKSTYLRTIGINAVLAMAGAPVRAEQLQLTPLQVGSSLHVVDSLQTGRSGFASELDRLRDIIALMDGELPVLFLLDELLHGTNSHDRYIGGQALLRGFIAHVAIGVVTTHDLSITEIPADLKPLVCNAHFEDRVEDGRMVFDYRLREGVVARSNALELMRSIGLDV